jgi:CheY-like chemotaxis protein
MTSEPVNAKVAPMGRGHILYVDDEELLIEWCQALLARLGYEVTAAQDSAEALKIFTENLFRFDLVITDQTMPKFTGLRLVRKLLKIRPDIPIILSTGHSDAVSPERAKEAGIKEFLMKPLEKRTLAEAIRRVLNKADSDSI